MVQKLPEPLIDLYNTYIHGGMTRREFVDATKKFAVGGLTVAAIMEGLMPNYALGEVVPKNDARLKTEYVTIPTLEPPKGNTNIKGYLVRPASASATTKLPAVLVVHENRGLNPHIEDVARRFGLAGFMAYAPDGLTSVGGYPGDDDKGGQMFNTVNRAAMTEDLLAAGMWLKNRPDSNGKLGITGFCFGGGISNTAAWRLGADVAAIAPFYGQPAPAAEVPKIKAAVLVHHGATDTGLVNSWPTYEAALKANNVTYEGYIYPGAGHGFNNDASPQRYNEAASKQAMDRTIAWFNKYLK
jgi:carboxymethylenebutenolidase